ncbi:MAG: NAD-dependent succinate-semialdehyde dehydrogenase [Saprospiraceae bacterium]|nr:NAD-dependent succinate-semialdehyde dehydrogenase [Saprospiraceae bacterium]
MSSITTLNPATNQKIDTYQLYSPDMTSQILTEVQATWKSWRQTDFEHRAQLMRKAARVLRDNKKSYATMMMQEMGKVHSSGVAEIEKCAWVCEYYADNASTFLEREFIESDASSSYISYEPLGVILAVMPWNYPFWQVFRFAAPTLMAGNCGILKHASNVPGCALLIEDVFIKAGFPDNTFRSLLIPSSDVEAVIENDIIKAVTLTGSGPAGSAVASKAGQHIKKTVLELGGSDPYLILEDADIALAASQCCQSRLLNAGQSCIGAKRFIVVDAIYDAFLEAFKDNMSNAIMGNPVEQVDLGPMARHDLRDEVHDQVVKSIEKGAKLELGGNVPDHEGAFYPPTILTKVKPGMPAYDEEIFGPVASVIRVKNEEEAIRVANDSSFGLGGAVFTKDIKRGERIAAQELQSGCCFVNQFVKSDPRLPFGGIKTSGYGRELSYYGIREFVNIKTVYINNN